MKLTSARHPLASFNSCVLLQDLSVRVSMMLTLISFAFFLALPGLGRGGGYLIRI